MNKPNSVAVQRKASPERERISLLVPASIREALLRLSAKERRTLNAQCEVLLANALRAAGEAI